MVAVTDGDEIVGTISPYENTPSTVSIGPEIFAE